MSTELYSQPPGASRELPTEPGLYYGRYIDSSRWEICELRLTRNGLMFFFDGCHAQRLHLSPTDRVWIRIPPAEDLLRLIESAKWVMQDAQPSGS